MEKKNRITNTSKQDPIIHLVENLAPGGIERSEARGQKELCNSEVLPTKGLQNIKEVLEAFGAVFGDGVEGDPLFRHVTLPAGWKKVATDHSMWSNLVDEKGRKRASIFYKASFYARDAFIRLSQRYTISSYENDEYAIALDGKEVIHQSQPFEIVDGRPTYESRGQREDEVKKWLDENFPEWNDPSKYWD